MGQLGEGGYWDHWDQEDAGATGVVMAQESMTRLPPGHEGSVGHLQPPGRSLRTEQAAAGAGRRRWQLTSPMLLAPKGSSCLLKGFSRAGDASAGLRQHVSVSWRSPPPRRPLREDVVITLIRPGAGCSKWGGSSHGAHHVCGTSEPATAPSGGLDPMSGGVRDPRVTGGEVDWGESLTSGCFGVRGARLPAAEPQEQLCFLHPLPSASRKPWWGEGQSQNPPWAVSKPGLGGQQDPPGGWERRGTRWELLGAATALHWEGSAWPRRRGSCKKPK